VLGNVLLELDVLLQVQLLRTEEFMYFRQLNTSMVLGTDMKKHFDIMSRFQVAPQPCSYIIRHLCSECSG